MNNRDESMNHPSTDRLRSGLLLAGFALAVAGAVLPVPWVWAGDESLFGLPRSFVWVICLLGWSFLILVLHFSTQRDRRDQA